MAIDENKKKAIKDSEKSVKDEEAEKALISEEEEAELSEEDKEDEKAEVSEDKKESEETEDEEDEDEEEEESKPKAKKDPVPAIMIVLIYAIIIGAILFYVIPTVMVPSFGYTLDEFNTRLQNTDISQRMNAQYTTLVPQFKLVDKNSIKEIWSIRNEVAPEEQKKIEARFKPFVKTYAATEELEHILVEANTRANDGQLTRMCVYCTFDNEHVSMMMVHFGAVMAAFTDLPFNDATQMLMKTAMEENKTGLYTIRGDIAYKLSYDNISGQQTYIKLEVLPAKAVKADRIKSTIPVETTAPAAFSETTVASESTSAS